MQLIDSKNNIYINENAYCFVAYDKLSEEEVVSLDNENSLDGIFQHVVIDVEKTLMLHLNPPVFNKVSFEKPEDMTSKFISDAKSIYGDKVSVLTNDIDFSQYILPRFRNLSVKVEKSLDFFKVYKTKEGIELKLKRPAIQAFFNSFIRGFFDTYTNTIKIAYPIFFIDAFSKSNKNRLDNLLDKFFNEFCNEIYLIIFTFIHELKHAFDENILLEVLRDKKISIEDFLKLEMYSEKSAEIQSILYRVAEYEKSGRKKDYFSSFIENYGDNYKDVRHFIVNDGYWKDKENFFKAVYSSFLNNYGTDSFKYILDNAKDFVSVCPLENVVPKTLDNSVYLELKKKKLSFDIYNPETKQWELQDWSDMFEEPVVNKRMLSKFTKFLEKEKVRNKEVQTNSSISDDVIKKVKEKQNLKLNEIRQMQLYQK